MQAGPKDSAQADAAILSARRTETLLKVVALKSAIFNSAKFSSIATDAKGVIQSFNAGAQRMLGYSAAELINTGSPADISDPLEIVARAAALSSEFGTPIAPGFEALVFKAARGIEDIYELTYLRKDRSRFPAVVSVTALRDATGIIGYLMVGTGRHQALKVLVVDDDPIAVELSAVRIMGLASTVLRAYGGRDAIATARRELPDLIVLDLMMPDVNGFDVVDALNEHGETARIPILVITAKQITAADRARLSGSVASIMEKGEFDRESFAAEVRRAISGLRGPPMRAV